MSFSRRCLKLKKVLGIIVPGKVYVTSLADSTTTSISNLPKKAAYSEAPSSRYSANGFHHPADKLNTLSARGGHFLEGDVAAFDAPFFNITAQEAKAMDPTARMLLEVTYEAFENAGLPIEDLVGSQTSCYVGCFTRDYHEMLMRDAETSPMYAGTGTGFSLLSNRISWFYDLRGPSMTLDTACSSSLVGLHLACQGLRVRESKLAVVSGANLILSPDLAMWLSNLHMTSRDGLSRSFADGTTGYGRGEGIATLILKPLADALRDGDAIRAVIRGTGVNQDGHTTGITLPNSEAQADLIRSTYRSAGLDFSHTGYFEAHGTGTAVGDPLELGAVAKTMAEVRKPGDELLVGSVKSNIGHLEGAAGLAGVIKCILMLESGTILPNIHFDKPNRRIPFKDWKIRVPTNLLPWPSNRLRRASVNSFGYGGTNAHAILDDAGEFLKERNLQRNGIFESPIQGHCQKSKRQRLLVFSARDEATLDRMRIQYSEHLESLLSTAKIPNGAEESRFLDNISHTLSKHRSRFDWKSHISSSSVRELKDVLTKSKFTPVRSTTEPRIGFIFSGQGAQWPRMGIELLQYSVFKTSISAADTYLKEVLGSEWSVVDELQKDENNSSIQRAKFSQPLCTILQVALVDLLQSWNIKPSAVVGHSSGEIGAAYCYGAITREDAWKISYWRGKLCSELHHEAPELKGAMIAAGLSPDVAHKYIAELTQGKVVVACINSPSSVTISGDEAAIDGLSEKLKANSVFCRKLKVENAYHSHHMQLIAKKYLEKIAECTPKIPASPANNMRMASSVTGDLVTCSDLVPTYWVQNLVSPVLFSTAIQALSKDARHRRRRAKAGEFALDFLLEVGPHAALKGPLRQILQEQGITNVTYESMILRGEDAVKTAAQTAGILYCHGSRLRVSEVSNFQEMPKLLTDLPPYPWNHSLTYWSESRLSQNYRSREHGRHDLLGSVAIGSDETEPKWRHFLRTSENPWIQDHIVHSSILYPRAGIVAMPIEAARQLADKDKEIDEIILRDVQINKAIVINDAQEGIESFLHMRRQNLGPNRSWTGWWEFSVTTRIQDQDPQENGSGLVKVKYKSGGAQYWTTGRNLEFEGIKRELSNAKEKCSRRVEPKEFYQATARAGLQYGPSFQGLTELYTGNNYCHCVISVPDTKSKMPGQVESCHLIHPTTLDIMFHSLFAALGEDGLDFKNAAVPIAFESLTVSANLPSGANANFSGFCHATRSGSHEVVANIYMSDIKWDQVKVQVKGIRCRELPRVDINSSSDAKAPCGTLIWKPDVDFLGADMLADYLAEHDSGDAGKRRHGQAGIISGKTILKMIDLIAHKTPDLSILQLGRVESELTTSIISSVARGSASTQVFSKYILADVDHKAIETAEELFRNWKPKVAFTVLDKSLDLKGLDILKGSMDVIMIFADMSDDRQQQHLMSSIYEVLKPGGYVLAFTSQTDGKLGAGMNAWRNEGFQAGAFPLLLSSSAEDDAEEPQPSFESLVIARTRLPEEADKLLRTVFILIPQAPSHLITEIANEILAVASAAGIHSRKIKWPPQLPEVKSHSVISLLEIEKSFLADISSEDFYTLKNLLLETSSMLWVTKGAEPLMNAAVGYLRSVKNENPNLNIRYLRVEDRPSQSVSRIADMILKVAATSSVEREFVEIEGRLSINRWVADAGMSLLLVEDKDSIPHEHMAIAESLVGLELVCGNSEESDSYYFNAKRDPAVELKPTEVEIEVKAICLNPRDLNVANQSHDLLDKELSGFVLRVGNGCTRIQPGDRVCAIGTGPYCTIFRVDEFLCNQIPLEVSFEEASCWPLTYGAAYHSLHHIASLKSGKTVLIQAAASAAGQAAVQLAKALGATVYATARSEEECNIIESFSIPRDHIFSENNEEDLAAEIKRFMQGKGFDVILNHSLSGGAFRHLWLATGSSGIFIDASRADVSNEATLSIAPFQRGASFTVMNMDLLLRNNPSLAVDNMTDAASNLQKFEIQSITSKTVFAASQIGKAFRYLQSHGNVGKTIVSFNHLDQVPISPSARNPVILDENSTYIIAGGLGGLGQSLAWLLIENGAKYLIFLSRSGAKSTEAQKFMASLSASHVVAKSYACDISKESALKGVLQQCSAEMPRIKGIIQSAAVLNDSVYENMTHEMWQGAIRPKIHGTRLLHELLPKDMDFFVMLSSISGVVGNRSQANYAAGNTFQDSLAQHRRDQGLPAVSIDLGLMLDIGLIAQRGGSTNLRKSEAVGLHEHDFHAIVKAAIAGSYGGSQTPAQLITGLPTGGILRNGGLEEPFYYDDPRFRFLKKSGLDEGADDEVGVPGGSSVEASFISQLALCGSLQEASRLVSNALCARLAKALQTTIENIDSGKPLYTYGVDSLMAVDFRNWIMVQMKAEISLFDVISGGSIDTLASKIAAISKLLPVEIDRRGSLDDRRGSFSGP